MSEWVNELGKKKYIYIEGKKKGFPGIRGEGGIPAGNLWKCLRGFHLTKTKAKKKPVSLPFTRALPAEIRPASAESANFKY